MPNNINRQFPKHSDSPINSNHSVRQSEIAPARVSALEAILDVQISDAYAGLALTRKISSSHLSALDRRLMTELFYGVLENKICLDYILSLFSDHPCKDDVTLNIIRMGIYQIVFMEKIPGNAICNDAVELARRFHREKMCGFVNAVLRNLLRNPGRVVYPSDFVEFLSVRYSFPKWFVELLIREYGRDFAMEIISYRNKENAVTIRYNPMKMETAAFEKYMTEQGFDWKRSSTPGIYSIKGGFVSQHPGFKQGLYSIIGEASYLAALAVGAKPGMNILDACAAPAGKTGSIAEQMGGAGRVYAWDLHEHRVKLITETARRLSLENIRARVQDASVPVENIIERMDAVLVDAPCSGLGDYLSKPDIKYRLRPDEFAELHEIQLKILDTCSQYVKPGGTLVYSTCTLLKEENENTVDEFLDAHPSFELSGLTESLPPAYSDRIQNSTLSLFPHRDGTDGFYIARMVRRKKR